MGNLKKAIDFIRLSNPEVADEMEANFKAELEQEAEQENAAGAAAAAAAAKLAEDAKWEKMFAKATEAWLTGGNSDHVGGKIV